MAGISRNLAGSHVISKDKTRHKKTPSAEAEGVFKGYL
jgi:hypothetical protein